MSCGVIEEARLASGAVLVTGAAGFVGRHVVEWLVSRDCAVVAASRRAGSGAPVANVTNRIVANIGPGTDWRSALEGVDRIVHLAAHVHVMRDVDPADCWRVNVDGTRRLAEQAAAASVRRFVFVSSIKVNGEVTAGRPFRADDRPAPEDDYGRSKLAAEQEVWRVAKCSGMQAVVVRPVLVYGPGAKGNFARLVRAVRLGIPLPFGSVRNGRSMISVWNLAALIGLLLEHPDAAGRVWLAADSEAMSTPQLVRRIADVIHRPARIVPMPIGLLKLGGRLVGQGKSVRRLTESLAVDSIPAQDVLGFQPPLSVDEALRRSVAPSG